MNVMMTDVRSFHQAINPTKFNYGNYFLYTRLVVYGLMCVYVCVYVFVHTCACVCVCVFVHVYVCVDLEFNSVEVFRI